MASIYARVEDPPGTKVEKLIPGLHTDGQVDELLAKNVFNVQQELAHLSHCR